MPTYRYRCEDDNCIFERWVSIHADSRTAECPTCGGSAVKVMVVPKVSVNATPSKGQRARDIQALEDRWDKDMPAYRTLRRQGYQPSGIDGAHALARDASDPLEVALGRKFASADELHLAKDTQQALAESARDGEFAVELGKAKRA